LNFGEKYYLEQLPSSNSVLTLACPSLLWLLPTTGTLTSAYLLLLSATGG
jgi:hypothetical protein